LKILRVSDLEDDQERRIKRPSWEWEGGKGRRSYGEGRREEWGGNLCVKKKPLASLNFRTEKLIEFASNLSRQPLN